MIVYQTDRQGVFIGAVKADESPLEPGVFLIPAGCVNVPPPNVPRGKLARWRGNAWQLESVPSPSVPDRVSRFQARAALMQAGLLAQAEAAVAQAGPLAQLAWADAVEFRRTSPTINALAPALGLTAQQIDALFIAAAQIEA